MAKQQFLNEDGLKELLTGVRKETADAILEAFKKNQKVKLISEVDATKESEEGCIYIDASNAEKPLVKIGDGKAYIVDLPSWDIGGIKDIVDTLKSRSVTADVAEETETLRISYVYGKE